VAVVNLAAEEPSPLLPRSMVYCRFPIMDGEQEGEGVLDAAIHTVASLLRNQVPTLVHCGAGMSRSPAVVAGHPHDVSPQLWEAIEALCQASQRRT